MRSLWEFQALDVSSSHSHPAYGSEGKTSSKSNLEFIFEVAFGMMNEEDGKF